MLRRSLSVLVIFAILFSLSGCATARKQKDLEVQALRNQVSVLEAQLQNKEEEIGSLKEALQAKEVAQAQSVRRKRVVAEVKCRRTVKQIQVALKNAGYNPGSIDGKMGKQTKNAIRTFQRANGLAVDGRVGKQTWSLLSKYLYQKVK